MPRRRCLRACLDCGLRGCWARDSARLGMRFHFDNNGKPHNYNDHDYNHRRWQRLWPKWLSNLPFCMDFNAAFASDSVSCHSSAPATAYSCPWPWSTSQSCSTVGAHLQWKFQVNCLLRPHRCLPLYVCVCMVCVPKILPATMKLRRVDRRRSSWQFLFSCRMLDTFVCFLYPVQLNRVA